MTTMPTPQPGLYNDTAIMLLSEVFHPSDLMALLTCFLNTETMSFCFQREHICKHDTRMNSSFCTYLDLVLQSCCLPGELPASVKSL